MAPSTTNIGGECCLRAFEWDGTPAGTVSTIPGTNHAAYVTGNNPSAAVLYLHDILGWTFPNARLLADHYAREANVTVYVPDLFDGWVVSREAVFAKRYEDIDMAGFLARNNREKREPEIIAAARALRAKYARVGVVGFCYGGWASARLGAKDLLGVVDCVSIGHPGLMTKADVDALAVPTQLLAPEIDEHYPPELKTHTFQTLQALGLPFEYHHFPGVEHGCLTRGDEAAKGSRDAMVRGKNAAVAWFKQWLQVVE
ncbi:Alpha/Beta hydrolase protein [Lasiosphaeria miniovina]|uniref:Alpha/Beta hydrolase protein n=1 Tax=Lasiosphaeria miniovina TaxID=1954250 RepID=A0AA40B4L8_9PEZI|nr:Alpha/Beta hydrolase protein [Lasiosphaeria miniovina]KAK0727631.1 Alpha/Beta hydrolase protein [Lasiosphaeria miniovina]